MKNALKEALEANKLPEIRKLLVEIIVNDSGKTVPVETVTEVLETTPGLFDDDNGKKYADSPAEMTPALVAELVNDLKSNFSLKKFQLLTETYALRAESPDVMAAEAYIADQEGKPEVVSDSTVGDSEYARESSGKTARIVSAIIMALGCAAAIVGLCVPVKFLLGLGIGVFMLGTALFYVNIKR